MIDFRSSCADFDASMSTRKAKASISPPVLPVLGAGRTD
jgi:hypothetical protein